MLPSCVALDNTGFTEDFPENLNLSFVSNDSEITDIYLFILGRKIQIHAIFDTEPMPISSIFQKQLFRQ